MSSFAFETHPLCKTKCVQHQHPNDIIVEDGWHLIQPGGPSSGLVIIYHHHTTGLCTTYHGICSNCNNPAPHTIRGAAKLIMDALYEY